jgi:hypothetical protein
MRSMDDAALYRFLQDQLDGRYDRQRTELDRRFAEGQARNAEGIQGLSSRMDLMQGRDSGSSNYRTGRRLDMGQVIQIAVMLIMVASVIVVFAHGSG